jgi:hypothetical protein
LRGGTRYTGKIKGVSILNVGSLLQENKTEKGAELQSFCIERCGKIW